ncbi:MAG TPA: hypothetical protein PLS29_03835 [Acidimicrobiales bacterium]|nr:hypothetical protein [Acidimicrobiales bacterium]
MAEVLLRHLVGADPLLVGKVEVSSAGTARWHVGAAMDPRARRALDRAGLTGPGSPASYASTEYLRTQDLVVVMTREHVHEVRKRLDGATARVALWRELDAPGSGLEVPDPYYGDDADFAACLALLSSSGPAVTAELRRRRGATWSSGRPLGA